MKHFLPIGTVVKLKTTNDTVLNIMVIGRTMRVPDKGDFQYSGVVYPYGFVGEDTGVFFNEEQIEEVIYEGLVTEEEKELSKTLVEEYNMVVKDNGNK